MNLMHDQTPHKWQSFFTEFKELNAEKKRQKIVVASCKAAEHFFRQFNSCYSLFIKSGGAINVWDIAGIGTDEIRNCGVLGWLLDCHGSHGQGALFLYRFLEIIHNVPHSCRDRMPQVADAHVPYRSIVENTYVQDEPDCEIANSRVDIVIENESFLLFIEAKVRAGETGNQLERYNSILRSRAGERASALVFLTPNWRESRNESAQDIVCLSWKQLADSFEASIAADLPKDSPQPLWIPLVQQFCQHIRTF